MVLLVLDMNPVPQVTVLGLGRMGSAMAFGMAERGLPVSVWNRSAGAAERLAERTTVRVAGTVEDAVGAADVVICMLSCGDVTEDVLLDEGLRSALKPGVVVCDMGTSGVATARRLARKLTGVHFVDAPVSGSVPTIEAGQLLIMASGDDVGIELLERVTTGIARRVLRLGEAGGGQAMKLAVNLIVYDLNAALSEALSLAGHAGIDAQTAYEVFSESVIAAPYVLYKRDAFLHPSTPVSMSLGLVRKDLELITSYAAELGSRSRLTDAALDLVNEACEAGHEFDDLATLGRFLRSAPRNDPSGTRKDD